MEFSQIKSYARKNSVPIMLDQGMEFILNYIEENSIKDILEIGTAIGYSAMQFAKVREDIHVTTVEIDIDRFIQARQNIHDCGFDRQIDAFNTDGLEFETDKMFDMIFIDAAKAQYIKFFERFKKNLKPTGVIISDNLLFHGMVDDESLTHNYSTIKLLRKIRKYVSFLKSNPEFNTEFFNTGDGVSVSRINAEYKPMEFRRIEKDEIGMNYYETSFNGGTSTIAFKKQKEDILITIFDMKTAEEKKDAIRFLREKTEEFNLHMMVLSPELAEDKGFIELGFSKDREYRV